MKATQINIHADRPTDIPAGWIIFNAPRPIYGTQGWKGEFKEGVFYAAVDPSDSRSQTFIRENLLLRAVVCNYVTQEECLQWGRELCEANGYDFSEFETPEIMQSYFAENTYKEIELNV